MDGSEDQPSTSSTKRMKYDALCPLTDEELLKIIDDISTESDVEFEIEGSDENGSDEETDLQPSTEVSEADNRTWLVDRPDLGKIPFSGNAELKLNPDGDQPIDFFNFFLNDNFFELVLEYTNNYAVDEILSQTTSNKSRITNWKDNNCFKKKYTQLGHFRANRAGNPKEVISKKLNKGETCGMYTNKGVSKWKDKREVLAISTEFGDEQVTTISKRGIEKGKPRLIVEYNKKTSNLYDFRLAILESLFPPPAKPEKQPLHHLPEYYPKDMNRKAKRRRCKYCWSIK
nr:unnamed protein product [Callosobruchus chinensis]